MPVTAKLSKKFYERLGEDVANELVDWFNQVDATYRADLRELNELNFQRFDAKLEQRLSELRSELHVGLSEVRHAIDRMEERFDAKLVTALAVQKTELLRWTVLMWIAVLAAVVGLR